MSVEVSQPVEAAPVAKAIQTAETPATAIAPVAAPGEVNPPATTFGETAAEGHAATGSATEQAVGENVVLVKATPAAEGILGYKAPGFLKQFVYSKHYFWFGEEPSTSDSLTTFLRNEKADHHHAAWAQETGKGVLFYTKRSEDKSHPAGLILLSEADNIVKVGATEFSFEIAGKHHKFETMTTAERDSWLVAVEKAAEESKAIKDDVTGRDSYKKTLEGFAKSTPVAAAAVKTERSRSKNPKKSLEANSAIAAASEPTPKAEAASLSSSDKDVKKAEKAAKKERSQSGKRSSIFGMLGKKDEDKEVKKEEKIEKKAEKEHEKEVKKVEKEQLKEEKKAEAEIKKEEAKATHDSSKAVEAAEAAAVAAVPAVAVAAEKKEEKKEEAATTDAVPTEKKAKRGSVFGSLFGKKGVTSPASEKTEAQATSSHPVVASEIPPVSETAPKLEEPIENKPIDTAAVTAPADASLETPVHNATTTPAAVEPVTEAAVPASEPVVSPKSEKKGGFLGFIKKPEQKKELKEIRKEEVEEAAIENKITEPVPGTAAEGPVETEKKGGFLSFIKQKPEQKKELEKIRKEEAEEASNERKIMDPLATSTTEGVTEPTTEAPVVVDTAKEERPTREKRRSSFFNSLGTMKKKNAETSESEDTPTEIKREKSPLPGKLGGLFRKPSKAVKSTESSATPESTTAAKAEAPVTDVPATGASTEPTASKIVGDVVPDELHTTVHDTVTVEPTEAKTSA